MKRLLPLILALLLLTACAAEAAPEGSAEPTPVPTPESTPPEHSTRALVLVMVRSFQILRPRASRRAR